MIVHDAAALWITIIARAQAAVEVAAGLAAMLLCAGGVVGMWAVRGLWRTVWGGMAARRDVVAVLAAAQPPPVPEPPPAAERRLEPHTPAWARKDAA